MKKPYKWVVDPKPTGTCASFSYRAWPRVVNKNDECIAYISCNHDYTPARARSEEKHNPLKLYIANNNCVFIKKGEFATLAEAKVNFDKIFNKMNEAKK